MERVAPGVAVLFGAGGNIALSYGADGNVIVDDQFAPLGDKIMVREGFPFIDIGSGGPIDGLIGAATRGLTFVDANTRVIPGHGAVARRADYAAYRAMLVAVRAKVAAGIAARRSKPQVVASKPAAAFPRPAGFIDADGFVGAVYDSLRKPPKKGAPHRH